MFDIETAIIGAGPYGLSLAAHLAECGASFAIFGRPMESWRSLMPTGMILKSEPMASNLWDPAGDHSLEQFSRGSGLAYQRCGTPLSLDRFLSYADWFRKRVVPDINETYVTALRREADGGFVMALAEGGLVKARKVVMATGHASFASRPESLSHLPSELASHSIHVSNPDKFGGRDIVILGLGQSALETAALLFEAGARVRILGRGAHVAWNEPPRLAPTLFDQIRAPDAGLGAGLPSFAYSEFPWAFRPMPIAWRIKKYRSSWGPSGAWWLKDRIVGKIPLLTGLRIEKADEVSGRVRLRVAGGAGQSELVADHVIACTGFDLDFQRLPYIETGLRDRIALRNKAPILSASFETSVPGLYAIGLPAAPTFGPSLRFMYGAKFAARTLTRVLNGRRIIRRAAFPRASVRQV
jgi:cation diffusion facilitator CzcD-associated flavoprotein CzcO